MGKDVYKDGLSFINSGMKFPNRNYSLFIFTGTKTSFRSQLKFTLSSSVLFSVKNYQRIACFKEGLITLIKLKAISIGRRKMFKIFQYIEIN
jgi:hypothetical protein